MDDSTSTETPTPRQASNNIDEAEACLCSHDGLLRAATLVALRGERRRTNEGSRPFQPEGPTKERAAALPVAAPGLHDGEAPPEGPGDEQDRARRGREVRTRLLRLRDDGVALADA